MNEAIRYMREEIKTLYAKEANIALNDPAFWQKINEYKRKEYEKGLDEEPEICPHCGQEII